MGIIKKESDTVRFPVESFSLEDITERCEKFIAEANQRAEEIIGHAQEQSKELRQKAAQLGFKEGYQKGFDEGHEKGVQEGRVVGEQKIAQETQGLDQTLQNLITAHDDIRSDLKMNAEADMMVLVNEVVKRILKVSMIDLDQIAYENLKEAIRLTAMRRIIKVMVNPLNLEQIKTYKSEIMNTYTEMESMEIVGDESVDPGGAVVVTKIGRVDMNIRTQLTRLEDHLFKRYHDDDSPELTRIEGETAEETPVDISQETPEEEIEVIDVDAELTETETIDEPIVEDIIEEQPPLTEEATDVVEEDIDQEELDEKEINDDLGDLSDFDEALEDIESDASDSEDDDEGFEGL